jgi:enoyl-CoA hydratase/carnithine racemase
VLLLAKHPLVDRFDLSSLKVITSAAAPLSAELAVLCARRLGCVVTQGYGLTETSPAVFVDGDRADTVTPGTVGSLVPGTLARLVLEDGTDAPRGGPGELWLKGPQVMSGYLNRPDETAAAFADGGWLRTGDIATVDGAGRFAIADRVKELIKHKGFQVAPSEIEGVLLSHPAVADCAVVPSPDDESGEVPKAFVVRKGEVTAEELIDFVAERVTSYKRVRDVQFVDVIPRSAAGKVLRRELVERERTDRAAERSRVRRLHDRVTVERHGEHVLLIGLDRQNKMNAFDPEMFWGLAEALTEYDDDPTLRCAVLFGHGRAFTSGLDLATSAPLAARGELTTLEGQVNPWGLSGGRLQTKPVIGAVHGRCWTLGIELLANLDIRLAAEGTRFAQLEVSRGLFPFGGATVRLPALTGWGNAMRWMLTGDEFDAVEAHRIGLVQEVVPAAELMARAIALADKVAAQAPLGVQATIASSRLAASQGEEAALARLSPEIQRLMASEDFREGVESFFARRPAAYTGR